MIEKLMTLLVGILLALAGWSLSRTFELSTIQAVHEDKVQKLEVRVEKLQDKMDFPQNFLWKKFFRHFCVEFLWKLFFGVSTKKLLWKLFF